jgi:hypothetical protein
MAYYNSTNTFETQTERPTSSPNGYEQIDNVYDDVLAGSEINMRRNRNRMNSPTRMTTPTRSRINSPVRSPTLVDQRTRYSPIRSPSPSAPVYQPNFGYQEQQQLPQPQPRYVDNAQRSIFKHMKPPIFNGNSDIRTWLATFEVYATAGHWNDVMKFAAASDSLQGLPKRIFDQQLLEKGVRPWNEVKNELTLIFGNTQNKTIAMERLNKRVQKDFEPIENFYFDKMALINEINPNMREDEKISLIVGGLNRHTKNKYFDFLLASPQQPRDSNELFNLLKKMSDVSKLMDPKRIRFVDNNYKEDNYKGNRYNQNYNNKNYNYKQRSDNQIDYLVKTVKDLKFKVNRQDYSNKNYQTNKNQTTTERQDGQNTGTKLKNRFNDNNRDNITCYNCNKIGHYSTECKAPKKQGNAGRQQK